MAIPWAFASCHKMSLNWGDRLKVSSFTLPLPQHHVQEILTRRSMWPPDLFCGKCSRLWKHTACGGCAVWDSWSSALCWFVCTSRPISLACQLLLVSCLLRGTDERDWKTIQDRVWLCGRIPLLSQEVVEDISKFSSFHYGRTILATASKLPTDSNLSQRPSQNRIAIPIYSTMSRVICMARLSIEIRGGGDVLNLLNEWTCKMLRQPGGYAL